MFTNKTKRIAQLETKLGAMEDRWKRMQKQYNALSDKHSALVYFVGADLKHIRARTPGVKYVAKPEETDNV